MLSTSMEFRNFIIHYIMRSLQNFTNINNDHSCFYITVNVDPKYEDKTRFKTEVPTLHFILGFFSEPKRINIFIIC